MASSSQAAPASPCWKYHVFLSFRGPDTLQGITSALYDQLQSLGIKTFMDESDLEVGDPISPTLLKAIEESRFAIVVLSPNYAQSTWCLEELTKICECMEDNNRILPLFYNVELIDVRHQKSSFGEAFDKHERSRRYSSKKLKRWREALSKVASFSGWDIKNFKTAKELVKEVVDFMFSKVRPIDTMVQRVGAQDPDVRTGKLKLRVTDWRKGNLLGYGSFGRVYEAFIKDGEYFIAVKEVSLLDQGILGRQRVSQLEQEIVLLSQFEHKNIVQYYDTQKDKSNLYIFLELVTKGSLQQLYAKNTLPDIHVSEYTRQILQGLKYLHDQNVIHRDIKCANILVHVDGSVKLADFGLAKIMRTDDIQSCKGTTYWMAPEVVACKSSQGYGLPADIRSLGCTVLEMLTRMHPYPGLEWQQAFWRIANGELPLVPDSLSIEAQDFIHQCLQVEPAKRPTADNLLKHPFVNKSIPSTSSGSVF